MGAEESIVQSTGGDGKNTKDDVDTEIVSLQKFVKDALSGQTYTIDMLHCDSPIVTSDKWQYLVDNRKMFYTKNMKAYIGYVKQQAAKYGIKGSRLSAIKRAIEALDSVLEFANPPICHVSGYLFVGEYATFETIRNDKTLVEETYYTVNNKKYQLTNSVQYVRDRLQIMYDSYGERAKLAMRNEGVDWKALSHALRAGYQMKAIYEHGDFSYPMKETDIILATKKGELQFNQVSAILEQLVDDIHNLSEQSSLPEECDVKFWKDWVTNLYLK